MSNEKEQNFEFESFQLLEEDEIAEVMKELLPEVPEPANDAETGAMSGTSALHGSSSSSDVDITMKSLLDVGMSLTDAKKAVADPQLYELAVTNPKRAKSVLANRQSSARAKVKKAKYIAELETKQITLQTESASLRGRQDLLQKDIDGLTRENAKRRSIVQTMEQENHMQDSLYDALRMEVNNLMIATGQVVPNSGPARMMPSSVPHNFALNPQFHSGPRTINQHQGVHPSLMPPPQQIIMQQQQQQQQQEAQVHVMMQQQQAAQAQTQAMVQQQQQVQMRMPSQAQVMMRSQLQGMQQQQAPQAQPHVMMQQQQAPQAQTQAMVQQQQQVQMRMPSQAQVMMRSQLQGMQQQQAPQAQPHVIMQQQQAPQAQTQAMVQQQQQVQMRLPSQAQVMMRSQLQGMQQQQAPQAQPHVMMQQQQAAQAQTQAMVQQQQQVQMRMPSQAQVMMQSQLQGMQQQQAAQAQTQAMVQQQQQVQMRMPSQAQVMMQSQLQGMQQQQAAQAQPHVMMQQQQAAQAQTQAVVQQQQQVQMRMPSQAQVMVQQHGTMPTSSKYKYIDPLALRQQEYHIMGPHILLNHLRQLNHYQASWSGGDPAAGEGADAAPDDHMDTVANQDAAARPEGDVAGEGGETVGVSDLFLDFTLNHDRFQ